MAIGLLYESPRQQIRALRTGEKILSILLQGILSRFQKNATYLLADCNIEEKK